MSEEIPYKKLALNAFITSFLIGLLAIATHALINSKSPLWLIQIGSLVSGLFLTVSFMNIIVLAMLEKRSRKRAFALYRYALSFTGASLIAIASYFLSTHFHKQHDGMLRFVKQRPLADEHVRIYVFFILIFAINSIVLLIHNMLLMKDLKNKVELENTQLKLKNLEATYEQLKQQIHPHFLFNSLSTLKSLIQRNSQTAENYLIQLSGFLRTSMDQTKTDLIPLDEELTICRQYLEMQKMRFGDTLNFNIDIPSEELKSYVPFFSILPLLENAIKHNVLTSQKPLKITIRFDNGYIEVKNRKQLRESVEEGLNSGLNNLKRRYQMLANEEVLIQDNEDWFSVKIKLLGNENRNH
jgi:two-component system, LytTR family, sensor kinase